MVTHYARTFDGLAYAQTLVDKLELHEFLFAKGAFVSVLETSMYDETAKIHAELAERGLNAQSPEWMRAFDELVEQHAAGSPVATRLWAKIPRRRYVSFHTMNRRRGEGRNWYALSFEERTKLTADQGKVARSYRGKVAQVISGAIGYDDYEYGVDLYADDPLAFKKMLYEMRFDAAGSLYVEPGPFWSGLQFSSSQIPAFLDGDAVPQLVLSKKEEAADAPVS
jgi:chlorite dismutase